MRDGLQQKSKRQVARRTGSLFIDLYEKLPGQAIVLIAPYTNFRTRGVQVVAAQYKWHAEFCTEIKAGAKYRDRVSCCTAGMGDRAGVDKTNGDMHAILEREQYS